MTPDGTTEPGRATLVELSGKRPQVAADVFIAPTAVLIGDVTIEPGASVWFGAVLRGDFGRIVIGAGSCIQDNAVIHSSEELPTLVGSDVTIGHLAMLEGCVVEDRALIGIASVVLQAARVGRAAMVAAGSVVREGSEIPPEVLAAGIPATVRKPLSGSSKSWVETAAREYRDMARRYIKDSRLL
jgi:carbonic anhydrase/acetyltransferase-like protein (isoleucine patch superfamily)